jgi:hypothetical protein
VPIGPRGFPPCRARTRLCSTASNGASRHYTGAAPDLHHTRCVVCPGVTAAVTTALRGLPVMHLASAPCSAARRRSGSTPRRTLESATIGAAHSTCVWPHWTLLTRQGDSAARCTPRAQWLGAPLHSAHPGHSANDYRHDKATASCRQRAPT